MPYGKPKHVSPWTRENWPVLNKGNKMYAISEWQCWLIRNGNNIPDLPQAVADEIGKHVSWMSNKAKNLFQHVFAERDEPEEIQHPRTPSPGPPSLDHSQGPPTLHSPGIGGRNLRSAQPPSLRRAGETSSSEEEEVREEDHVTQEEAGAVADHQLSDSESENEFERELNDFVYGLKYRKQDICLHRCNKKIHIIVS